MFFELLAWWYGPGWMGAWRRAGGWISKIQRGFSIPELIANLFSPWKQIVALPGRSIDEKFKAMLDNLVSRVIGFIVRLLVLLAAAVVILFTAVIGLVMAAAWPLLPLSILLFVFKGFVG